MIRVSQWLIRYSRGWLAILSSIVFVLFMIFVLPSQSEKADEYAEGNSSPDMSFFYSPDQLFGMAEAYGDEGRLTYVRARFSFDLIFPLVYGIFLATTTSWLANISFDPGSRWRQLNLVPVVGVIFDLLENIAASLVMAGYPERKVVAAQLAPIFTLVKWVFVSGSFIVLLFILAVWVYRRMRKNN